MSRVGGNPLIGQTDKTTRENGVNVSLPNALHNDIDSGVTYKKEKISHRLIICAAAGGATNVEIAASLGLSLPTVSNVLRQPWARERMLQTMKDNADENIRDILKTAAIPALKQIIETSTDETVKAEVRLAASRDIVDRFLGKATQPLTHEEVSVDKLTDEELERRIAEKQKN